MANSKKRVPWILSIALPLALAGVANAATITEATEGDFPNGSNINTNPSFAMDLGANSVSGNLSGACVQDSFTAPRFDCNGGTDPSNDGQDSFVIEITAGLQLIDASLATTNFSGPGDFRFDMVFRDESLTTILQPSVPGNGSTGDFLSGPLGPGRYSVSIYAQSASEPGLFSGDYSYSFTTEATVIPLPASLPMLAGALALAGAFGWRRKDA